MGASSSSEFSSSEIQEFSKFYTLVKTSYDYRFGQVSIYQNNESKQLVLVSTKNFESNSKRTEFVSQLRIRQLQQHPSVCKVIGYSLESGSNICGNSQQVTVYTEFYQDDLLRELKARSRSGERYTEQEVWYLLETLVSALAFLQEQNTCHGDLMPQNVVLTNNGQAKILNNNLVSLHKNNFARKLQGQNNVYLAPEVLDLVSSKYISPQYNVFKSDVYALGLTFLYVTLLKDPQDLYNLTSNQVQYEQVDAQLNQVLQHYSYQLTDLIRQMLMQDPAKRPTAVELRGLTGGQRSFPLTQSRAFVQPQNLVQSQVITQSAVQRPVPQQAVVQRPVPQQAVVQRPVAQQSVVQRPAVQAPVSQGSLVQQGSQVIRGSVPNGSGLIRQSMVQQRQV